MAQESFKATISKGDSETIADTIEEENRKKRSRRWVRDPAWWRLIISVVQFVIIGLAVGAASWFISKSREQELVHREVGTLCTRLEESAPESYGPATEGLRKLGDPGIRAILNYAKNGSCIQTSLNKYSCIPWQKAKYLHKEITSFSHSQEDLQTSVQMIWASWMCYDYEPGLDVELYEILKRDPATTCPVVLSNLDIPEDYPYRNQTLISNASLLAVLKRACPGQSSPQLEKLDARFKKVLKAEIAEWSDTSTDRIQLRAYIFYPWTDNRPAPLSGPYIADDLSWRNVITDVRSSFSEPGTVGSAVMWHRLEDENLTARLIFGSFLLYFHEDAQIDDNSKLRFDTWVEAGLASTNRESKVAAMAAMGNLGIEAHRDGLRRVADNDPDPFLREYARRVLAYRYSSREFNPATAAAIKR